MKLIVGLGNPGGKYQFNRHNVGHMFVDYLLNNQDSAFKTIKTNEFMNLSGHSIRKILTNSPYSIENILIAHDDLDIPLGDFKIQMANGPKLHNGIRSIEETFGTKDFMRIRIGVDNRTQDNWINGEQYVLSNFFPAEQVILSETFSRILYRLKAEFF